MDASINALLDRFEGDLELFLGRLAGDSGFFLSDPRVLMKRVSLALAATAKAADAVRRLNQFERHAVKQLIHYHIDPDYAGLRSTLKAVGEALEVLLEVDLTSAQIKNPKSIVYPRKTQSENKKGRKPVGEVPERKGGQSRRRAYTDLANATLELWRQVGRKIDRSGKSGGVLHLTGLLVSCFDISIVAFAKFDSGGKEQDASHQQAVFTEGTASIAETLPNYIAQAIQAAQKRVSLTVKNPD